jgi:hypothetical protein
VNKKQKAHIAPIVSEYKDLAFILDSRFFDIMNEAYMDTLEPSREFFGTNATDVVYMEFAEQYKKYKELVMKKVEVWLADRKAQLEVEGSLKGQVRVVVDELLNKMQYLLVDFWRSPNHRIYFNTPAPIASTAWIKDLNGTLKDEEKWIAFVSSGPCGLRITNHVCYSHSCIWSFFILG